MKAITLHQPWATLMALGHKTVETRSWSTRYRGPLAIHAAATFPAYGREFANNSIATVALRQDGYVPGEIDLELGAILCVVSLDDVIPTQQVGARFVDPERVYGDYSYGRYAWVTSNPRRLDEPIGARGRQQLWTPPPHVIERLEECLDRQ